MSSRESEGEIVSNEEIGKKDIGIAPENEELSASEKELEHIRRYIEQSRCQLSCFEKSVLEAIKETQKGTDNLNKQLRKMEPLVPRKADVDYANIANMVYYELPMLLSKIAYASLAMVESAPGAVIASKDADFIIPNLEEAKRIFDVFYNEKIREIETVTKINEMSPEFQAALQK